MNRSEWTQLPHVARRDLDLTEEEYRGVLALGGVKSAKDIHTAVQFDAIMQGFKRRGFQVKGAARPKRTDDWWRCTADQRAKIEVLWAAVARTPTVEALHKFCARILHVSHVGWLDEKGAIKLILALRAMAVQAGLDPENAQRTQHRPTVGKTMGRGIG